MIRLMILLGVSMCLAYCSQNGILVIDLTKKLKIDLPLIFMVLILSFFCGLRTSYNDTELYIADFKTEVPLQVFLDSKPTLTENPLFFCYQSFFRHHISPNANLFFLSIALFSLGSTLRFIQKYSDNFVFSVFLFFALGPYLSHLSAMKQWLAIAVLTYAIEALIKKRFLLYFVIVFIAMLFHTYAIFFAILPLFINKPWTLVTYVSIVFVVFALFFFESAINAFLLAADSAGKHVAEEMVLDNGGINLFRLAVYAVPPLLSFFFIDYLGDFYNPTRNIFMNISILSFLIMLLGIFNAANLFGRSAMYFVIGTVIILPSLINGIFDKNAAKFISIVAYVCYFGFFLYSIIGFGDEYRAIGFYKFFYQIITQ